MSIPSDRQSGIPSTTVDQIADDAVILDVREQDEWDAGHAPHAIHIPLGDLAARLADLPETDATLAITCRGGGRSSRAVAWLTQQGFEVANLEGGMKAWEAAGKPLTGTDAAPRVI